MFMLKSKAIELLGGSVTTAAREIGVSYQAIDKWPDELPPRIADRVLAAMARKQWPDLDPAAEAMGVSAVHSSDADLEKSIVEAAKDGLVNRRSFIRREEDRKLRGKV
jgi:hypothetical protein